jgi:hypothetical protein
MIYACRIVWEMVALSNNYTSGPGSGASNSNSSSFVSRRESRANNMTGALPIPGIAGIERDPGSFKLEEMILSLRELFEQDRQIASQQDAARCGICYLYHSVDQLHYREEGLYVCEHCERALKNQKLSIIRKQQKL